MVSMINRTVTNNIVGDLQDRAYVAGTGMLPRNHSRQAQPPVQEAGGSSTQPYRGDLETTVLKSFGSRSLRRPKSLRLRLRGLRRGGCCWRNSEERSAS